MITIILKPRLASQAPKVSKIILSCGSIILFIVVNIGIINTKHKSIFSKQNNDMSKCEN
jgi:amino acid permease